MNPEQLMLQLGLAGALLYVVFKVAMRFIDRWAESEKEKNTAIASGFEAITTSVNNHSAADIASHDRMTTAHGELRDVVVRMDAKIDTIADLTPVTPVRRQTPGSGVPTSGYYPPSRPKTGGR